MPDKFEGLNANEKAALESMLYRCRALVGRIGEELRKKKPEHFVDESACRPSRLPGARCLGARTENNEGIRSGAVSATANQLPQGNARRLRACSANWLSARSGSRIPSIEPRFGY
jgi:hypothetical protein